MSGTLTVLDTPVVGSTGAEPPYGDGGDGGPGESEAVSAAPDSDTNFTPALTTGEPITPYVVGGQGGAGALGIYGANGIGTTVYDANFDETTTYTQGKPGGAGGSGGEGGAASVTLANDSFGASGDSDPDGIVLRANTTGGAGGQGGTGGDGGLGGENNSGTGNNPNTGAPTTILVLGAAGGNGGAGGDGGDGGAAQTEISGLVGFSSGGTTVDVGAFAGAGGTGGPGQQGSIGGETSAGGQGGAGGDGGDGVAILTGSQLADDYDVTVSVSADGGAGGLGESGGGGGTAETFSPAEPTRLYVTANGADGGNGGNGGNAIAELTGNMLTAPLISVDLQATTEGGGEGGQGGSGGTGVSTPTVTYTNGLPGADGEAGADGSGTLVFTGNTITVGTPIAGDAQHSTLNELQLTLGVTSLAGGTSATVPIDGGAGGNLVFSGNDFIGTGSSELDLSLSGAGTLTVDTAADTISIDGSPANSLVGFSDFILVNNAVFVVGPGNYVVDYPADADTLVYTPASGNVTLEGVTTTNLLLEFQGFGASLTPQTLQSDTSVIGGNTYIALPGAGEIELAGFTGPIPAADETIEMACYVAGTRIATPGGEVAVEALRLGDAVCTASGDARPIVWIGYRRIAPSRSFDPRAAHPIRIAAGAFGDGLPRRDLLVSPEHAMFLDGLLVPAACLVNGTTITQTRGQHGVEYYHIELATHGVILAEGVPSETYLDDDNRHIFANAADFAPRPPDAAAAGGYCAPRVESGYELEAIRERLATVAETFPRAA
jgi:hypothetical protein